MDAPRGRPYPCPMALRILLLLSLLLVACGGDPDPGTELLHPRDCDDAFAACAESYRETGTPTQEQCAAENTACWDRLPSETQEAYQACNREGGACCRMMDCRVTTACGDALEACIDAIPAAEVPR